ncbi:MAG: hypothetical protein H6703_06240 [Myxococcales bacterium]|nr:hypothetical protein [Myxococcales bacterium]
MTGLLLLALLGACPVATPQADPAAERARTALAQAPERPGLALAYGQRLLDAGAPLDAEACAHAVLDRWPDAVRARLLLARVALARGDRARPPRSSPTSKPAAPPARPPRSRPDPRRPPPPATATAGRFTARAAVGAHYDTRAAALATADPLPRAADPAALRAVFTGDVGYVRARPHHLWRARVGLDRTAHFATDAPIEAGPLDRSSLWTDAQFEAGATDRFGLGAELRGTLAGRLGEPHHLAAGLLAWWRRPTAPLAPWARLRAYGFAFGDAAGDSYDPLEAWTELAAGGRVTHGPWALDARLGAQWVGPGDRGFFGAGADLRPELAGRLGALYLLAGLGWRRVDDGDLLAPRAGLGANTPLGAGWTLGLDALWQRAAWIDGRAAVDRWVAGLILEAEW